MSQMCLGRNRESRDGHDKPERTVPWETPGAKDRECYMRRTCSREGAVGTRWRPKERMGWQGWLRKAA